MASSSTAHYHVEKLLASGLVKSEGNGFVVDRVFMDNFVRIGRTPVPIKAALVTFFAASLAIILLFARPPGLTSGYILGVAVCSVALAFSVLDTIYDIRQSP